MTSINNNYTLNTYNLPKIPAFRQHSLPQNPYGKFSNGITTFTSLFESLGSPAELEASAKSNPHIQMLAEKYNIPIKVNRKAYEELKSGHLKECRIMASKIASNLPSDIKSEVDIKSLQEAAIYHDLGKVLIPDNILNKNSSLNEREWEIMQLHSDFGYELVKNKDLSPKTLNLIKFHHQNSEGTGYPAIVNDFDYDINNEILEAADKYCALKEKRSYKEAMTDEEVMQIMKEEVSPVVYEALAKAITA